jgi:hypothetical protein
VPAAAWLAAFELAPLVSIVALAFAAAVWRTASGLVRACRWPVAFTLAFT